MPPEKTTAIGPVTAQTSLIPAINVWKLYLADQANSPHTIKAFSADLRLLASYLPPDRALGEITTAELNNFLQWMQTGRGVPCSPKTLSRRITSLKSFFRWLQGNGVILVDPAEKVVQQSVLSPLPEVLTDKEYKAVLQAAAALRTAKQPDARPYALLRLLLDTAIKKGECLGIRLNHVDLEAPGGPILFVRYASPQYRYKERKIALTEEWVEAFHEYERQYEPTDRLFPWSQRRLEYLLEDIGESAGLTKHLSFLMCRWTSALRDFQDGLDHTKIRQKLGVSEIQWRELRMKLSRLAAGETGEV